MELKTVMDSFLLMCFLIFICISPKIWASKSWRGEWIDLKMGKKPMWEKIYWGDIYLFLSQPCILYKFMGFVK